MSTRFNPYRLFVGSFIPNWLLRRTEITAGAKLCYARLAQFAGQSGVCKPRQETIAEELGTTKRTIQRHVEELVKFGLIESEQRGLNASNQYFFLRHKWLSGSDNMSTPEVTSMSTPEVTSMSTPYIDEENHKKRVVEGEPQLSSSRAFSDEWMSEYEKAHGGEKYLFSGVKDATAARRLLTVCAHSELLKISRDAWQSDNEWIRGMSASLAGLASNFNAIRDRLGARKPAKPARSYPSAAAQYEEN